ncbi:4a-hydroxytetrahydrobiopterin dehydratase [Marinicella sediminis]|uniref:Putative pterin-4-alpha-carbinolamine dehydratase n=1 Tax=Marinicella sediminis TaxID=1792834 RepID=A0ABV7J9X2_9GAMM|nr:4a-hydroxytetrahydrobiopterin dehydratase [Marinicella sediminis]
MNFSEQHCDPCQSGLGLLTQDDLYEYMKVINAGWQISDDGLIISRNFGFKNFAKTMFFINALANLADQQGHHPDVCFGYNYARVSFTTHEAKGLTRNDFICAKAVDELTVASRA